jgi:hypothetical protein
LFTLDSNAFDFATWDLSLVPRTATAAARRFLLGHVGRIVKGDDLFERIEVALHCQLFAGDFLHPASTARPVSASIRLRSPFRPLLESIGKQRKPRMVYDLVAFAA